MTESYGVLTIGSVSSGTVADGEQVTDASGQVIPDTAIESNLSGSGAGSTWLVNNALTVSSENMTMTAAPLSVVYTAITGDTAESWLLLDSAERRLQLQLIIPDLCDRIGSSGSGPDASGRSLAFASGHEYYHLRPHS